MRGNISRFDPEFEKKNSPQILIQGNKKKKREEKRRKKKSSIKRFSRIFVERKKLP